MQTVSATSRLAWAGRAVLAASALLASACATTPGSAGSPTESWSGLDDCFKRQVDRPAARLLEIAETCGGARAAGSAERTGIERANAALHAAAAYLALNDEAATAAACGGMRACLDKAHGLITASYAHQSEDQLGAVASTTAQIVNERFRIDRALTRARIIAAYADQHEPLAPCGRRTECLTSAAATLDALDLGQDFLVMKHDAPGAAVVGDPLYCDVLDTRSQTKLKLGPLRANEVKADLHALDALCPAYQASASRRLGEIAFEEARALEADLRGDPEQDGRLAKAASGVEAYGRAAELPDLALPAARGEAWLLVQIADWQPREARQYLERADAVLKRATGLAEAVGEPVQEADIRSAHGETLIALSREATSEEGEAAVLASALATLARADALDPSPRRALALARVQDRAGQLPEAAATYRRAIAGLDGLELAEARLELVDVLAGLGETSAAGTVLDTLMASLPGDPVVQFETGLRLFNHGNYTSAKTALRRSLEGLSEADRAQANHLLSLVESIQRQGEWRTQAVVYADRAVQLGAGNPRYSRQACLAHIQRGGQPVRNGDDATWCLPGETAAGALLHGMYHLKRAQLVDVSAYNSASVSRWRGLLAEAEAAFEDGLAKIAAGTSDNVLRLEDLRRDVQLSEQLQHGLAIVARCRRDSNLGPGDAAWPALEDVFGHYGVLKCS